MAEIKSALELALERTASVKGDKTKVEAHEARQIGMRLASRLFENPGADIKRELAEIKGEREAAAREGFFQVLMSNLVLPGKETDLPRLKTVQAGLELLIRDRRSVSTLMQQVEQLLQQYLDTKTQLVESLRKQFEPRLRQREAEIRKQVGTAVKLDPASDPDFAKALSQNLQRLQQQYGQVIDQAREQFTMLVTAGR